MDRRLILGLIFALFILSALSLSFSGLTIIKSIELQNSLTSIFLQEVQQATVLSAVLAAAVYIIKSILPLLPFLFLAGAGFVLCMHFRPNIKFLLPIFLAVFIINLLIKPSIIMAAVCLGFLPVILISKTFEERKSVFKSAKGFTSSCLRWLNIFVVIGLFLGIYYMPNYEQVGQQQMETTISSFIPTDMSQIQTGLVSQISSGFTSSINEEWSKLPLATQTQCASVKDAMLKGIENYGVEQGAVQQEGALLQQGPSLQQGIMSAIPIFSVFSKMLPLTTAIAAFVLLEILRPILAIVIGFGYILATKKPVTKRLK